MKKLLLLTAPWALLVGQEIAQDIVIKTRPGMTGAAPNLRNWVPGSGAVEFLSMEMGSASIVKNSPYSADSVTETVQTLGDGNRIIRKNSVTLYRDSEGRTRREFELQSLGGLGDLAEGLGKSVAIDDPVAKVSYQLNAKTKTATKMPRGEGLFSVVADNTARPNPSPSASADVMVFTHGGPTTNTHVTMTRKIVRRDGGAASEAASNSKVEELGARNIEGVEAKGTRTTLTIPAGEVGNERPIEVLSERWYSEQLKTLVLSKHTDPRFGETTLRLTNVRLGEPPATLFEVPADYTIQDASMKMQQVRKVIDEKKHEE